MSVTRAEIDAFCAGLPGTRLAEPPGELLSWKVGGRMFACFGDFEDTGGVAVRTRDAETAAMLIETGIATRAPYFRGAWVRLDYARTELEEMRHRLAASYDAVRASLKKSERDALPPREEA